MSDDSAYAESLFRTAKYRSEFPARGFVGLETARSWAADFVHWYNVDQRHSGDQLHVSPGGSVTLNPERDCFIKAHTGYDDIQRLAA